MKYLIDTLDALEEKRAAVNAAEGPPRRSVVYGGPDMLPRDYAPGAAGWTYEMLAPPVDAGDGTGVLEVTDEMLAKHNGEIVDVAGKRAITPATKDVLDVGALPAKYASALAARDTPVDDVAPPAVASRVVVKP